MVEVEFALNCSELDFNVWRFLRKLLSAGIRLSAVGAQAMIYVQAWLKPDITIARGCQFGRGVVLRATDGGRIRIGPSASIGAYAQLLAQGGLLNIGDDVQIGIGAIIVCRAGIEIGADSLIGECVVVRDKDHGTRARPIRHAGFIAAPIRIGGDVWIGAKATILRGVTIGDGAVVGAPALVRSDIPSGKLAVGIPARFVSLKQRPL